MATFLRIPLRPFTCLCLLSMTVVLCRSGSDGAPLAFAQAASAPSESCTLHKGAYTCDWKVFRERFALVHSVSVQVQPMDRPSETRLRQLIQALGKTVAAAEGPTDLTLRVIPAESAGVAIGPADQPLATLVVSAPGRDGGAGTLLWVETFSGQADRPWPTVVGALANQFEARFKRGK